MNKKFFALLIALVLVMPLLGAGCIINIKTKGAKDGGVFKSVDQGETWEQKVFIKQISKSKTENIQYANVWKMFADPQNAQTIYLSTLTDGLFVTYNGADKWTLLTKPATRVEYLVVDPKSRSILYLATANLIFKSTDGGSNWARSYAESALRRTITFLAIDNLNTKQIYAGISDGRLIRSLDAGESWKLLYNFEDSISQILINKNNTKIIYIATASKGIFRTMDGGIYWTNITVNKDRDSLKDLAGINTFKTAVFDATKPDSLLIATKYGLLKTDNGGSNWTAVKLLNLPQTTDIFSLAINPKNNQEIYYTLSNALYRTLDGGKNWTTLPIPSSRSPKFIFIDPKDTKTIYLGVMTIEKK